MNIFKILANGDGTLNEANISAFLGYLLNPYQDHGLGFEFLTRFLELLEIEEFNPSKFDYGVYFEQAFREKDKSKKIVDIVLLCFESSLGDKKESFVTNILKTSKKLKYIFLIENKINEGSIKSNQLDEQFNSTKKELGIEEEKIYSIYVTPEKENLKKEFDSFTSNNKFHLYWNTENKENENTVYGLLKTLLEKESRGEIESVNDYTKQTINSFIHFIKNGFKSEEEEKRERKNNGTYTQKFIDLNNETRIKERLQDLVDYLVQQNKLVKNLNPYVDLSAPRFPKIKIKFDDYEIDLHAGSISRNKIGFAYRINSNNMEKSKEKLNKIISKYNLGSLKNAQSREAYCRTHKMQYDTIELSPSLYETINLRLNEVIKMADI